MIRLSLHQVIFLFIFAFTLTFQPIFGTMYHHSPSRIEDSKVLTWTVDNIPSFCELIPSLNAFRPPFGNYLIEVSLKCNGQWSPFVPYMEWGSNNQRSISTADPFYPFRICVDQVLIDNETVAEGFSIKVSAREGAVISHIRALHCFANDTEDHPQSSFKIDSIPPLEVPILSQFAWEHPHKNRICSATSLISVIHYIQPHTHTNMTFETFCPAVYDEGEDIYGNWVLNLAEASNLLGTSWECWLERLDSITPLLENLKKQIPIIISVKGDLPGAPMSYHKMGHLLVVIGYDSDDYVFICMDPASPPNSGHYLRYPAEEFIRAWGARDYPAYLFRPKGD